jgi:hypothetical protein
MRRRDTTEPITTMDPNKAVSLLKVQVHNQGAITTTTRVSATTMRILQQDFREGKHPTYLVCLWEGKMSLRAWIKLPRCLGKPKHLHMPQPSYNN